MAQALERMATGSKIRSCNCNHEFQDSRYGLGLRVHTVGGKANSPTFRCTVCGKEKGIEVRLVTKEKEKDKKKEKRSRKNS